MQNTNVIIILVPVIISSGYSTEIVVFHSQITECGERGNVGQTQ